MSRVAEQALLLHATARSSASPAELYDALADLTTHLTWGGEKSASRTQRLLTLNTSAGPATAGATFTSTGAAGKDTFHDRSIVITASRPDAFAFRTDSQLERRKAKAWRAEFFHDYQVGPEDAGSVVTYTFSVKPMNYVPYWLRPGVKLMTRMVVTRLMRQNLKNLARLAEGSVAAAPSA